MITNISKKFWSAFNSGHYINTSTILNKKKKQATMNTILILGSTSDIGHALAEKYLTKGNTVILAGRNQSALNHQKKELQLHASAPRFKQLYLTDVTLILIKIFMIP